MKTIKAVLFTIVGLVWPSQPPVVTGNYLERRRRFGAILENER